jgi:hypothetical protein
MATIYSTNNNHIYLGGWQAPFSIDGGVTWNLTATPSLDINIPSAYPQYFPNYEPENQGDSPAGHFIPYGPFASSGGDNRCSVDAFGVFWWTGLYCFGPDSATDSVCGIMVGFSQNGGKSYYLGGTFKPVNTSAISYDYPVVAAGSDGKGGAAYYVTLKPSATQDELIAFGSTNPVDLIAFHTSAAGVVDNIQRVVMPGTEPGHYGGMTVGPDGTLYYIQMSAPDDATDPQTGQTIGEIGGRLGTTSTGNGALLFTKCSAAPKTVCQTARIIARTDYVEVCPNAQPFRCTWSHPDIAVDKFGVIYVGYTMNVPQSPATEEYILNDFTSDLWLVSSRDGGVTWSAPRLINDDHVDSAGNSHFMMQMSYDSVKHALGFIWLDTRSDPTQTNAEYYGATIKL